MIKNETPIEFHGKLKRMQLALPVNVRYAFKALVTHNIMNRC